MTTQRFDIEVQDRVARSIRTEITGIGTAARTSFASLRDMKNELAGLSSITGRLDAGTRTIRDQAAAAAAAAAAARDEAAALRDVTRALEEQARAERALADARRANPGAPPGGAPSPPPSPGGGGGGAGGRYNYGGGSTYVRQIGDEAQISSQHLANLSFQLNDVFVSLASGQNPMTVFIQQGAQIGQIATQAGVGLGALGLAGLQLIGVLKTTTAATEAAALAQAKARAINIEAAVANVASNIAAAETEIALAQAELRVATTAQATAAATARLTAANAALAESNVAATVTAEAQALAQAELAAAQSAASRATTTRLTNLGRGGLIAAAAMVAATVALGGLNSEINETVSKNELTEGLNLTAKEMRKLEDVTVTWGDTAKAIFQVTGAAIWEQIGGTVTSVWNVMSEWLDWLGARTKEVVNYMIGDMVGAYRVITTTWRQFPAVLGDMFVSGVNAAIEAINELISASVTGVNGFIEQANSILPDAMQISQITAPQIATLENQWAGAMERMGATTDAIMKDAFATDYLGNAFDAIQAQAVANARARIRRQAEEAGFLDPERRRGGRGGGKTPEEKRAEALEKINRELDSQLALTALYGPALERETRFLTIRNSLMDKGIALSAAEEDAIRIKIALVQEGERVQAHLNRIEEAALGPQREYVANLTAIEMALRDNIISEAEAARQRNLAATELEDALDPLRAYHEEIARGAQDLALYGQQLSDVQRARELFDRDVAAGVTTRDQSSPADYMGQAAEERRRQQMTDAFAAIDPREREDPSSSSFVLDHAKEMYAELERLREEDLISEEEAAERKRNLDRAYLDARLEHTGSILGQISQLQNSKNKELAALGKAAAIAQATIDGYRAVQAALVGPPGPPWSFAIAGATAAMTAANVARIAGVGFMSGGFTGHGANNEVAGSVHRNEYVFDAAATRRIGVPALEAMRRGTLAQPSANDNGGRGGNVIIRPMPGVFVEERRTSEGEIELIAKRVVAREAGRAVAADIKGNPNSPASKALGGAYGLKRADR
jgi:hypothetical protein